jgi:hypothetical protein
VPGGASGGRLRGAAPGLGGSSRPSGITSRYLWGSTPRGIASPSRAVGQGMTGAAAIAAGTTRIGTDDDLDVSQPLPFAVRTCTR